jgi:hypothetical protein
VSIGDLQTDGQIHDAAEVSGNGAAGLIFLLFFTNGLEN